MSSTEEVIFTMIFLNHDFTSYMVIFEDTPYFGHATSSEVLLPPTSDHTCPPSKLSSNVSSGKPFPTYKDQSALTLSSLCMVQSCVSLITY